MTQSPKEMAEARAPIMHSEISTNKTSGIPSRADQREAELKALLDEAMRALEKVAKDHPLGASSLLEWKRCNDVAKETLSKLKAKGAV